MPGAGSGFTGEHLDADELNSYAENVLPEAARARYTEHLADCAGCRELVVQLSASAGVIAAADQAAKVPAPSGWRNFLANLFSPMVLRYAVPALGLIVVAAIGFVLMNRNSGFVARNSPVPSLADAPKNEASPSDSVGFLDSAPPQPDADARSDIASKRSPQKDVAAPIVAVPNAPPGVSVSAEVKKQASDPPPAEQTAAAAPARQPEPKPEPQPTPTADFQVTVQTRKQEVQRQANEPAKIMGEKEKSADQGKAEERKADDSAAATSKSAARREAPSPGSRARGAGVQSAGNMQIDGVDNKDEATRAVAGRRFRRERDIWIDTAYNSGTSTVNVRRGSEQYRALVADEPLIKTIADQLGGEIIVVWKGRAYRIR